MERVLNQARRWVKGTKTDLYQGHAADLASDLDTQASSLAGTCADLLCAGATFLRNQQRRMRYLECCENGWPIGSGTVESGCKQFQSRLTGPGMRLADAFIFTPKLERTPMLGVHSFLGAERPGSIPERIKRMTHSGSANDQHLFGGGP